ncbi:MAG: adenosylcobinamide-GDP ribazoletransferase [Desulfovibrionaceae bacterium]
MHTSSPCDAAPAPLSWAAFGIAVAFLTRLTVPRMRVTSALSAESIAASVVWYPVVGLGMGAVCTVPVYGVSVLANAPHLAWVWAWGYVCIGFFLTRGLHWDGLADITDAWGSGAQGPQFWKIVKDSRLGAFGAMGQVMAFSAMLIAAQAHISQQHWWPLVLAPCLGRAACIFLGATSAPRDPHSLGAMACLGATVRRATLWALSLAGVGCVFFGGGRSFLLALAMVLLLLPLRRLAQKHGGCNGDFLGTAIVLSEVLTLMVLLV